MTDADIKRVVNATIDSMLKKNMIRYNDNMILSAAGNILTRYYDDGDDLDIKNTLDKLKNYTYYDVLEMYYRDHLTLEKIAEKYNVDVSTIRRNKKKLCIRFYNILPERVILDNE